MQIFTPLFLPSIGCELYLVACVYILSVSNAIGYGHLPYMRDGVGRPIIVYIYVNFPHWPRQNVPTATIFE